VETTAIKSTTIRKRDRSKSNEARRKQLIEATIESIAIHGFNRTMLSTVTSIANTSHGIVNFHFQGKDQLLLTAIKYLADGHQAKQNFQAYLNSNFLRHFSSHANGIDDKAQSGSNQDLLS
jgi:AcrR family transcriptional regulator